MKTASIQELKLELQNIAPGPLRQLCLRLAKFKKENKELLTYLLFEAHDEEAYIASVKQMIEEDFEELPKSNPYLTKKSLRKTIRSINKYIRYAGSDSVQAALLVYFCIKMKHSPINYQKNTALFNIYESQIKKCIAAIGNLHPDLQYDLLKELKNT